jgi:hypothetical protein
VSCFKTLVGRSLSLVDVTDDADDAKCYDQIAELGTELFQSCLGGFLGEFSGCNLFVDSSRPSEDNVEAYENPNAVLDTATDELTSWHWS